MKLIRTLFAACALMLVAMPATASAQSGGGPGDNYLDAIPLGTLAPSPAVVGVTADTTNYTTEGPGGSFGAAGEFNQCGQSAYGKTAWSYFTTDRTGRIDITAAGFDAVIGLASFASPQNAVPPEGGPCVDRLSGRIESFPRDNLPTVKKGNWYAIQVGGFQRPDGSIDSGNVEVAVELLPPEQIIADAGLTWRSTRGGIRVTSVRVDGPQGSIAGIGCIRKRCGRDQTVRNPKLAGVFKTPVAKLNPSSSGKKFKPAKASDEPVRMATKNVFRGRKVPNGGRLAVVVISQNEDQIGQVFYWDVRRNAAGAKNIQCVEPDGRRFKRQGTCTGA
jgi:hypothetical protein